MTVPSPNPTLLYADEDCDWMYYVPGHDPEALLEVDELDSLVWEPVWMRPIRQSQKVLYGFSEPDPAENIVRNPKTGRFEPRWFWIECSPADSEAQPFIAARYKP